MKWNIKRKLLIAVIVAAALISGMILISSAMIDSETDGLTYSDISYVPRHKVGLVLGCPKKLSGGRENIYFVNRIIAAVSLFRAGKIDYLLVSGDNVSRGCNETVSMRTDLIKQGIPADRIYCDFKGMRTLDSVVRARDIFGQNEILIISQEFHNRRAVFIAKHEGINAVGFNAEDVGLNEDLLTHLRDLLSRLRAIMDVYILNTQPKFKGETISIGKGINARSNCTEQ
jgi:SanA protein